MQTIDFRNDLLPLKNQLYRLALRITLDTMEAEDVVQDTLIRIWQRREELKEVQSLEAFCLTTCRNLALDRRNLKASQTLALDTQYDETPDSGPSTQERLEQEEKLRRVHEIISRLPEQYRTIIQLRDIEGHTYKELADIMQLTDEQVKVTLFRARKAVRDKYQNLESYGL